MMSLENRIKAVIRDIPDYPKPGIVFKDIAPLLGRPDLVREIVAVQSSFWKSQKIDGIAAIEARGFIFGSLLAQALECPFIPVRKSGKLPFQTLSQEYELEYGKASIEMHVDALHAGPRILIHDDLLATGGTALAAGDLVNKLGGQVIGFSFLINLGFLSGAQLLENRFSVKPNYLVEY